MAIRTLNTDDIAALAAQVGVIIEGPAGAPTGAPRSHTGARASQAELDADPLLRALHVLGLVQDGPRSSPMGIAYDIECPWSGEHTDRATSGTVYVPVRTKFRCHHGHCDARTHEHLREKVDELLREDSGGTVGLVHFEFDAVDPAAMPVSPLGLAQPVAAGEARFLADTIYVGSGGRQKFWSISRRIRLDDDALNTHWHDVLRNVLPRKTTAAKWYRDHPGRRDVDGFVSWPGGGSIVVLHGRIMANTWVAPVTLIPIPVGRVSDQDVSPWLLLVHHVLGADTLEEGEALELALDWMALVVGGWVKPGWHVLITGRQGLGKDVIILPIVRALGEMATEIAGSAITGRFNPWAQARLVQVNEMRQTTRATSTAHDQNNALKLWDNSRETVRIDEKGIPVFEARNVFSMWLTSNEDVPVKLDPNDRRFVVFNRQDTVVRRDLIDRYLDWLEEPILPGSTWTGGQLVHAWLDQRWRELSPVRLKALTGRAFMTAAKREMIDADTDEVEDWMQRGIEASAPAPEAWPDIVWPVWVHERLSHAARQGVEGVGPRTPIPNERRLGQMLKKIGATYLHGGKPVRVNGTLTRLWAVRNAGLYVTAQPEQLAKIAGRGVTRGGTTQFDA